VVFCITAHFWWVIFEANIRSTMVGGSPQSNIPATLSSRVNFSTSLHGCLMFKLHWFVLLWICCMFFICCTICVVNLLIEFERKKTFYTAVQFDWLLPTNRDCCCCQIRDLMVADSLVCCITQSTFSVLWIYLCHKYISVSPSWIDRLLAVCYCAHKLQSYM